MSADYAQDAPAVHNKEKNQDSDFEVIATKDFDDFEGANNDTTEKLACDTEESVKAGSVGGALTTGEPGLVKSYAMDDTIPRHAIPSTLGTRVRKGGTIVTITSTLRRDELGRMIYCAESELTSYSDGSSTGVVDVENLPETHSVKYLDHGVWCSYSIPIRWGEFGNSANTEGQMSREDDLRSATTVAGGWTHVKSVPAVASAAEDGDRQPR